MLLRVIDIYSKYARFALLKDKKGIITFNVFKTFLNKSNHKANKISVDKGREFYNISVKSWLQDNNIEMYSAHSERKTIVAERFIRTLKKKSQNHLLVGLIKKILLYIISRVCFQNQIPVVKWE